MPHDVDLSIGADASPTGAGLAELRNFGQQARSELNGIFAQTFAIGGAIAAFDAIINKAHEIHHEADRFRIDGEQLQTISNAAQALGIPLELVARAMNLVELNAYKAVTGSEKEADALARLGINAQEFYRLSSDQKVLALADAYVSAGDKGEAYANISVIIGRRNTELIPLFEQGADAIRKQSQEMGILGDKAVEVGEKMHRAIATLKNIAEVDIGGNILLGAYRVYAAALDLSEIVGRGFLSIWKTLSLDIKGANAEAAKFMDVFRLQGPGMKMIEELDKPKPAAEPGSRTGEEAEATGLPAPSRIGAGRSGTSEALKDEREILSLEERIGKLREEHLANQRSKEEQLNELITRRRELEGVIAGGRLTELQQAQARVKLAETENEIDKTSAEIEKEKTAEAEKYQQWVAQAREEAEQDARDGDRRLVTIRLQKDGRKEEAQALHTIWGINDRIEETEKKIAIARAHGDSVTEATLLKLREELGTEQALAGQELKLAQQRDAADNRRELFNIREQQAQSRINVERLQGQETQARYDEINLSYNTKINAALEAANRARAEGKKAIAAENEELARQLAIEQQIVISLMAAEEHMANLVKEAKIMAEGLMDQMNNINAIFAAAPPGTSFEDALKLWQLQRAQQQALRNFQFQSLLNFAQGGGGQRIYGQGGYLESLSGLVNAGSFQQLQQMLDSMLAQLQSMNQNLTPQIGSH